ncbi:hypothetical protein [Campylobacter concisus]|uniref:hypothetical protein n=1 Tax=Campylobacter concisus TaxID=199 RepID=UPI0021564DD0|nr:hypothetical protein [Campylobacter concisus]
MSILISFVMSLAIYNLHYLDCANMFNIVANKNISDENTAKYMNAYIDKFGCNANITLKSAKLRYEPNLLEIAFLEKKLKTLNSLLDKGTKPNSRLAFSIGTDFLFFFRNNGVGFESKTPSKELLKFIKTQKYKEFKEEKFKLIKQLLDHGQDPKDYDILEKILNLINDDKDLIKILKEAKVNE